MSQSTRWVFTLNNYTEVEYAHLESLGANVGSNGLVYLVFGREVSATGTPHLQGFATFSARKRLRFLRGFISPRGHYEVARGESDQAADYCKKEGDFVEFGQLPNRGREPTSTVADFCNWVGAQCIVDVNERNIAVHFPGLFLRYGSKLMVLASHLKPLPSLEELGLNDWQEEIHGFLMEDPDDREIRFVVDREGGKGKSFFCRWMLSQYPDRVQVLSSGKRDDLAHAIDITKNIFLFNMPRGGMEFFQYSVAESLKDRIVFSPKYNSTMKVLNGKCHVVVFCNEDPDETKLSEDRLNIKHI
uniref:Replication-associated protein n=1 Tax=Cressdnaviricota sp. TaxID=2748378 RepID=A0A6M3YQ27_9VIRU|nr:MAG: replication-associated protein [Cressdnaviricota sp.]QJI53690.1 MAG: replication-associated protein [Cressdnaviricota sp.]QKN88874.1 MAG: replication-associated protein [Cressdnaviricota sp.]